MTHNWEMEKCILDRLYGDLNVSKEDCIKSICLLEMRNVLKKHEKISCYKGMQALEKLQKIQEIVTKSDDFIYRSAEYKLQEIREILEDGNTNS